MTTAVLVTTQSGDPQDGTMDQQQDLDVFLKHVETISDLVNELQGADAEGAAERADHYLSTLQDEEEEDGTCRTIINSTSINPSASTAEPRAIMYPPQCRPGVDSENFRRNLDRDATDRTQRRRAAEKRANKLKDEGNKAYSRQDYRAAVALYSDGLAELRDGQHLYTNRAQAYIKLGKFNEAINDCEWALKCNERCIKAYVHMGKANVGLHNYKEARRCFEKIVDIEPGRDTMAKEYLALVECEEERKRQELSAREELDRGGQRASTVPQLLEKLSRPDQSPLYYCGGLEFLSQAITDCTGQTLFRLNNGFSIVQGNDTVRSVCLSDGRRPPGAPELRAALLRLWLLICRGNDENQKRLMACPAFRRAVVGPLAPGSRALCRGSLSLLLLYSQSQRSRSMAVNHLNVQMLMRSLMQCIATPVDQQEVTALAVLENFASDKKFGVQLRGTLTETVLVPFTTILKTVNMTNQHVLPSLISSMGLLVRDDVIRHTMAHSAECWEGFLVAMKQCSGSSEHRDSLYPLLGLICNVSTAVSPPGLQDHDVALSAACLALLSDGHGGVVTRAAGVLSHVLPRCSAALQLAVSMGVVTSMHRLLKGAGPSSTKYAIKALAVCTAASGPAREELLKADKRLSVLRGLLGSGGGEAVLGNAALCLGHCLEVQGAALSLLPTDALPLLLRLAAADAARGGRTDAQRNAAIALGKLCRAEPRIECWSGESFKMSLQSFPMLERVQRHMQRLRELHGVEILHSCMKLIA